MKRLFYCNGNKYRIISCLLILILLISNLNIVSNTIKVDCEAETNKTLNTINIKHNHTDSTGSCYGYAACGNNITVTSSQVTDPNSGWSCVPGSSGHTNCPTGTKHYSYMTVYNYKCQLCSKNYGSSNPGTTCTNLVNKFRCKLTDSHIASRMEVPRVAKYGVYGV